MNEKYMPKRVRAKEKYLNSAGLVIPSVTTALNVLAKPALKNWANRLGLQGIDITKYVDETADVGTLAHYLIMCRLLEEIPDVSEYSQQQIEAADRCYKKYIDWESRNPVKPLIVEEPLVSEAYQYGGRPDLYGLCAGELLLGDFKTSSGIFPDMVYQVAAYKQLLNEAGYPVSKAVILRIGRDDLEGAEEKILTDNELDIGFEIFLHSLEIYKLTTKGRV